MIKQILKDYPSAYAVYDTGKYYGVATPDESFYLVNKDNYKTEIVLLRYQKEAIKLIENAIPVWFADDD